MGTNAASTLLSQFLARDPSAELRAGFMAECFQLKLSITSKAIL